MTGESDQAKRWRPKFLRISLRDIILGVTFSSVLQGISSFYFFGGFSGVAGIGTAVFLLFATIAVSIVFAVIIKNVLVPLVVVGFYWVSVLMVDQYFSESNLTNSARSIFAALSIHVFLLIATVVCRTWIRRQEAG